MTAFPSDNAIEALAERVLETRLPRAEWTHEAHFALALWVLRHRPELSDPDRFAEIIRALNESHGTANTDSSGYHHTITVASLRATAAVLAAAGAEAPLHDLLAAMMAGRFARSDWILAYWSRECLFSVTARRNWVDPDLAPLPW